ncbi:MAG: hypothetical protein UIB39_04325, partial [Lachnospiraceae bacterium]|nr:hypothetical protein [Lachnospiraceae bacterium]
MEIRRCIQEKKRTERKQKVLLWILLVLLVLSGCGGGTSQTGSTADTASATAAAAQEAEEDIPESYRKLEEAAGTIEGRIYTNPCFRVQIAAPEGFSLYGSNVTEQLQGRSRLEAARTANSFMDMYGCKEGEGSLQSISVLLGSLDSVISPETMDLTIQTAISRVS